MGATKKKILLSVPKSLGRSLILYYVSLSTFIFFISHLCIFLHNTINTYCPPCFVFTCRIKSTLLGEEVSQTLLVRWKIWFEPGWKSLKIRRHENINVNPTLAELEVVDEENIVQYCLKILSLLFSVRLHNELSDYLHILLADKNHRSFRRMITGYKISLTATP